MMKTRLIALALLLAAAPAFAADNYTILNSTGSTVTMKSKDTTGVGGPQSPQSVPSDSNGNPCTAAVGATTICGIATIPLGATNTEIGNTIVTTNTWQTALAGSATRKGCLLQNQSASNVMYVFFGGTPPANGTLNTAFQINPGLSISCATATGLVSTDLVSVTGTSGDAYVLTSE